MNKQIEKEYINGTSFEEMYAVIYDCQIDGIKTIEEADALAIKSITEMLRLGYRLVEKGGKHYFEKP